MSDKTSIQWTDATWNPTRGCSRVSEGCRNCYAEGIAFRFSGPGQPFEGFAKVTAPRDDLDRTGGRRDGWTGRVELIEDKLTEPLSWRKPRKVFVNSMSDLFHEALPDAAIDKVFAVMALAPQHTFQVLTKRADRMRAYLSAGQFRDVHVADAANLISKQTRPFTLPSEAVFNARRVALGHPWQIDAWPLPNVWLGVSVENQKYADERIPLLLQTPAAVRFISAEPLLESIGLARHFPHANGMRNDRFWVIVGGESGHGARPFDLAWARSIVRQCKAAGVSVFMKQLGAVPYVKSDMEALAIRRERMHISGFEVWKVNLINRKGGDVLEWPADLRVREFPNGQA